VPSTDDSARPSIARIDFAPAGSEDVDALAALHVASWREAYRGMLPDDFLAGPVLRDREQLWASRLLPPHDSIAVIKAMSDGVLIGFGCVLLDGDPIWGADLDNLHVKPGMKRMGIGRQLLSKCRAWIRSKDPARPMYLWVLEANHNARAFYEREDGRAGERRNIPVTAGIYANAIRYSWTPLQNA
jgi:ribosomal protein S18 acetylase RimI-like enzyme